MSNRIVVIVNKTWEAAPIFGVFSAPYASGSKASSRPLNWAGDKPYPTPVMWPDPEGVANFRWRYVLHFDETRVEVWCLSDFADTSDSLLKSTFIPQIVGHDEDAPQLVIAVGTAASIVCGLQGSVIVGCRAFMHDANPTSPAQDERPSSWPLEQMDKMMESSFAPTLDMVMAGLFPSWLTDAQRCMLPARNGGAPLHITVKSKLVAVGDVNVLNYGQYPAKDPEALQACLAADTGAVIGSIETTSPLIRACVEPVPYLFISGIVNDLGQLSRDVAPTEYSQNFAGAHNAGVVLAALLPVIISETL